IGAGAIDDLAGAVRAAGPILAAYFPRGRAADRAVSDAAERLRWLTYVRPPGTLSASPAAPRAPLDGSWPRIARGVPPGPPTLLIKSGTSWAAARLSHRSFLSRPILPQVGRAASRTPRGKRHPISALRPHPRAAAPRPCRHS